MKKFTIVWQPLERTSTETSIVAAIGVDDALRSIPEDARILSITWDAK